MKRLFLTSSFSSVTKLFEDFAGEPVKGKKLAFIPTASLVEKVRFYIDDYWCCVDFLFFIVIY